MVETPNPKFLSASIVKPAVTPDEAIEAWNDYIALKKKICTKDDVVEINGKDFPKKSYWRKCATMFNLSVEVRNEKEIRNLKGSVRFDIVYRATAPNGRFADGDGSCFSQEKTDKDGEIITMSDHNTRSTAHTRAFNRAVSNLVGGGEVSAEEMNSKDFQPTQGTIKTTVIVPDDWRIDFGKFQGTYIGEVPFEELQGYASWLEQDSANKGKTPSGGAFKVIKYVEVHS